MGTNKATIRSDWHPINLLLLTTESQKSPLCSGPKWDLYT